MSGVSIYIHIPFCVRKCAYCDFTSFAGRLSRTEEYVEAVCREMRAQAAVFGSRRVNTVYLGGGTPTLLQGEQVRCLLDTLRCCFDLAPQAEITMEANPGTMTPGNLAAYREAGVNRLSLGVQSFDDGLLAVIGRIHTARQADAAARMAARAGFDNLSFDLMVGLPGQTVVQWKDTLAHALSLHPTHLSCYGLILEEGTPLSEQARRGTCAPMPDDDAIATMDETTEQMTRENGLNRYEISNYARPGCECRHNLVYWSCLPYLGLGCAAHSDMDGKRFFNPSDWDAYMHLTRDAQPKRADEGNAGLKERRFERMMMGLRMTRGVNIDRFVRDFGAQPEDVWPRTIARMTSGGLMHRAEGHLALTARGMMVMNAVLVEMMEEEDGSR